MKFTKIHIKKHCPNYALLITHGYLLCSCMLSSCHVHVSSTPYSCLNAKDLLAQSRCDILSLSDCNGIRSPNHIVSKLTVKHLANFTTEMDLDSNQNSGKMNSGIYAILFFFSLDICDVYNIANHDIVAVNRKNINDV